MAGHITMVDMRIVTVRNSNNLGLLSLSSKTSDLNVLYEIEYNKIQTLKFNIKTPIFIFFQIFHIGQCNREYSSVT